MSIRGGKRAGAGRKKGQVSAQTRARKDVAMAALASGITPLEYMLSILRNADAPADKRYKAAVDAAPYIHPRLASVEASVKVTEHEDNVRQLHAAAASIVVQDNEQLH